MAILHDAGLLATTSITIITYMGAFSRFTHGRYTPSFYAYQLDRAPDNESTRVVPYMDVTLATLILFPTPRPFALLACVLFQGMGIVLRLREGKNAAPDVALCFVAGVAGWSSFAGW